MQQPLELKSDERGVGLLFALFGAAVIAIVAWSMITTGLIDMAVSDNFRSHNAAFYAADAGIEQTLIDFKIDQEWVTELVNLETAELTSPSSATIEINGINVQVALDADGLIVEQYYPFGPATTIGDATYQREVWLPPLVAVGDCDILGDSDSGGSGGSGSGGSDSGDSSSGGSSSGKSGSGSSGSGKSGSGSSSSGKSGSGSSGPVAFMPMTIVPASFGIAPMGLGGLINPNLTSGSGKSSSGGSGSGKSGSGGSASGKSDSGGSSSGISVDLDDPCALAEALADSSGSSDDSGSSGGSGSGGSSSGGSSSGGSGSGKSSSGGSGSGKSSSGGSGSGKSSSGGSSSGKSGSGSSGPVAFLPMTIVPAPFAVAPMGLGGLVGPKVTICHVPPGNPDAAHTITIGAPAVPAHLANHAGDAIGACDGDDDSDDSSDSSDSDEIVELPDDVPVYVFLKVRSTGSANNGAQTRILAELAFTFSVNAEVLDIQVQNWREDR